MTTYSTKVSPPVGGYPNDNKLGGYGQTSNKYHKPRSVMGGDTGIYNPVGVYDKEIKEDEYEAYLKKKKKKKSISKKRRKRKKSKKTYNVSKRMNSFIGPTGHKQADDSFAYKGVTPFHYVDSATPLRAGNELDGDVLFESIIKEYVSEVICEFSRSAGRSGKTSISGKLNVKKSHNILGDKDLYPDSSMGPPMSSAYGGIKIGRTTNTNPNNKSVTNIVNKKTASGSDYLNAIATDEMLDAVGNFDDYDEELSSFQNLKKLDIKTNSLGNVGDKNNSMTRDILNVYRHDNKKEKLRNI